MNDEARRQGRLVDRSISDLRSFNQHTRGPRALAGLYAIMRLGDVIEAARGVAVDFFARPEIYRDADVAAVAPELARLHARYGCHERYLSAEQRHVIFASVFGDEATEHAPATAGAPVTAGGAPVTAGGAAVTADPLVASSGAAVRTNGAPAAAPLTAGGVPVTAGGAPVTAGAAPATPNGGAGGVPVTVAGTPLTANGAPVTATGVVAAGAPVTAGGAPVMAGGAPVTAGSETVTANGAPLAVNRRFAGERDQLLAAVTAFAERVYDTGERPLRDTVGVMLPGFRSYLRDLNHAMVQWCRNDALPALTEETSYTILRNPGVSRAFGLESPSADWPYVEEADGTTLVAEISNRLGGFARPLTRELFIDRQRVALRGAEAIATVLDFADVDDVEGADTDLLISKCYTWYASRGRALGLPLATVAVASGGAAVPVVNRGLFGATVGAA